MTEICALWGVQKSHTTFYYPKANEVVKRGNRNLRYVALKTVGTRRGGLEFVIISDHAENLGLTPQTDI